MKKIGFIGVGVMGKSMVRNLMKGGYEVFIYTRTKAKVLDVIEEGARWCDSVSECAKAGEIIITIVGYPKDVEEVYFGEKGIIENIVLEKLSFSADSSHIYFTYGLDAPEKEAYPYALVDYAIGSGKLNTVGNLTTPVVMTGTYGNSLFIRDNMEVEGTYTPNTYRYDIQ